MELARNWIGGICAAAIIVSVAKAIAPQNPAGRCVQLIGALVLILAVLSPLRSLSVSDIAEYDRRYAPEIEELSHDLQEENEKIQEDIIEEEMSTYISERARDLDIECDAVSVDTVKKDDGYLYPYTLSIVTHGNVSEGDKAELKRIIERECAIDEDKISFIMQGG